MRRGLFVVKTSTSLAPLWVTCQSFSTSLLRLNNNNSNSKGMNPETARQAAQEDRDELERERKLREQFVNKIHQQYPQYTNTATSGQQQQQQGASGASSSSNIPPFPGFQQAWKQAWQEAGQQTANRNFTPSSGLQIARLFFFAASIYLIMMVSNMRNPNSPLMVLQGMPWWQVPADTMLAFSLIRMLVGVRDQRAIKTDYETAVKTEPSLGFAQFLNHRYPNVLAGYRTQQAEILAALSACHIATRDFKVSDTIYRVIREKGTRDVKATIDALMEALPRDFPQVFAPQTYAQQPHQGFTIASVPMSGQQGESGMRVDLTNPNSEMKSM